MRLCIVAGVVFSGACSEHRFTDRGKNCEYNEAATADRLPLSSAETTDEFLDIDHTPDCWFREYNGEWQDPDGDGHSEPVYVGVSTLPVFTLLSPSAVTVRPGQDVPLEFSVASYKDCGDLDFNHFFFLVYDSTEGSDEWLKPLYDEAVPSDFEALDSQIVFPPYAAENMAATPAGNELFYVWKDAYSTQSYGVSIITQRLGAWGERVFRFTWTASEYAPLGRTFNIHLMEVGWKDVTTGTQIYSDSSPYFQGVAIEVTVTE
ncbi:MAG: hypothetical protein AAB776_00455 [Patescibacteria group bacterium]